MFKKLKEKITEEVKSSPQRFQQLTQSVSDRLQSASTSDENFFSIGEDDAPTMSANYEPGFTNVALTSPTEHKFRRNSNSSIASDVSFLPKYESLTNMYHLQSDLEISASEMEDNASSSSQLGHLSKEQIYSAFQKSQMRYHKYRGRYTDLAKHYKELEKENSKIKLVLVETQDKAIRRVTELKEQCTLEQKAKAHLEGALRDDIDEKEFKIQSLQTKIELLQNSGSFNQDGENLTNLNKYLTDARQEIETLNQRIQEMKANGIIFQSKEQEYKTKISNLEKELTLFSEREKENNLSLAQNKMDLHNELVIKDNEISNLKKDNEVFRKNLEAITSGNNKLENLQTQNKKLIDKVDTLTTKCNNYESELLKMEQYRLELQNLNSVNSQLNNQVKDFEIKLDTVREDAKKSLLSLENKIQEKLRKEYEEKETETVNQFKKKLDELSSGENNLKELQLSLMTKEKEIQKLTETINEISTSLKTEIAKYKDLETNHLELIEDSVGLRSKIGSLEKEVATLQTNGEASGLKLAHLRQHVTGLEKEIEYYRNLELEKDKLQVEEVKKSDQMEEEMKKLLDTIDEERRKREEQEDAITKLRQDFELNQRHLTEEVGRRNEEIASLQEALQNYDQVLAAKEEGLKKLEEIDSQLKKVEAEKGNLHQELKQVEAEKGNLNQEVRQIQEQLSSKIQNLEEEIRNLSTCNQQLEEDKKKSEGLEKGKLVQTVAEMRRIEEINGQLSSKIQTLEEERGNLSTCKHQLEEEQKKLEHMIAEMGRFEEINGQLSSKLQTLEEEIRNLSTCNQQLEEDKGKLIQTVAEMRRIEEINGQLSSKIQTLDEEIRNLSTCNQQLEEDKEKSEGLEKGKLVQTRRLEEINGQLSSKIQTLEEEIRNLSTCNQQLEKDKKELKLLGEQLEEKVKLHEQMISELGEELAAVKRSSQKKDEEISNLLVVRKGEEEEERNQILEEVTSLKEVNRIKEEELKKLEDEMKKLASQVEHYVRIEEELSQKNHNNEESVKLKDQQIEILSKRLEDCNDLIKERNKGIVTIFNNFLIENPINFVSNGEQKQLQSIEEKMQNFEKIYSVEKENLTKILTCLKQFEEDYLSMSSERNQLRNEKQELLEENTTLLHRLEEISVTKEIEEELVELRSNNATFVEEVKKYVENIKELEARNTQVVLDSNYLSEENTSLVTEIEELKIRNEEIDELKTKLTQLEDDLTVANNKLKNLPDLEQRLSEVENEKLTLVTKLEGLQSTPVVDSDVDTYVKEIEMLKTKVVQYKSLDLTNRSSIEFYENELQKTKNQNEKLNRKLDETLVTLNHCSELSNSTEIEYLKNVLFNYMLGKESLVMARVIAAVCKFDPHQTELVLAKEQQKQTLLGQLGIL